MTDSTSRAAGVMQLTPGDVVTGEAVHGVVFVGSGATITKSQLTDCDLSQLEGCTIMLCTMIRCVLPPLNPICNFSD